MMRGMGKLERKEVAVRVKDLMTRRLVSIDAKDTVTEAARLMDMMRIHSILIGHGNESSRTWKVSGSAKIAEGGRYECLSGYLSPLKKPEQNHAYSDDQ